jgi:hypothetical protein
MLLSKMSCRFMFPDASNMRLPSAANTITNADAAQNTTPAASANLPKPAAADGGAGAPGISLEGRRQLPDARPCFPERQARCMWASSSPTKSLEGTGRKTGKRKDVGTTAEGASLAQEAVVALHSRSQSPVGAEWTVKTVHVEESGPEMVIQSPEVVLGGSIGLEKLRSRPEEASAAAPALSRVACRKTKASTAAASNKNASAGARRRPKSVKREQEEASPAPTTGSSVPREPTAKTKGEHAAADAILASARRIVITDLIRMCKRCQTRWQSNEDKKRKANEQNKPFEPLESHQRYLLGPGGCVIAPTEGNGGRSKCACCTKGKESCESAASHDMEQLVKDYSAVNESLEPATSPSPAAAEAAAPVEPISPPNSDDFHNRDGLEFFATVCAERWQKEFGSHERKAEVELSSPPSSEGSLDCSKMHVLADVTIAAGPMPLWNRPPLPVEEKLSSQEQAEEELKPEQVGERPCKQLLAAEHRPLPSI